ncbi:hypothetical protein CW304_13460 [Bacillus sp. UFRGS-B20]|nr:hypothetical protein CW304_13460 [Bacillus sp. UFRGS-B20]
MLTFQNAPRLVALIQILLLASPNRKFHIAYCHSLYSRMFSDIIAPCANTLLTRTTSIRIILHRRK